MRFKVSWHEFRTAMAGYTGRIYVEETDTCFRLFMCPNETMWTEVVKTTQVQDFRFVDTYLQKGNIFKVDKVDWDKTESEPFPEPDEELTDPEELIESLGDPMEDVEDDGETPEETREVGENDS